MAYISQSIRADKERNSISLEWSHRFYEIDVYGHLDDSPP